MKDEESGLLMGFWRSLSGRPSRLRPTAAAAGRWAANELQCNSFSAGVECRVEQPVDGQVSGPQVFRKSDHLPHPPPLLPPPSAQNQRRARKGLQYSGSCWRKLFGVVLRALYRLLFFFLSFALL